MAWKRIEMLELEGKIDSDHRFVIVWLDGGRRGNKR